MITIKRFLIIVGIVGCILCVPLVAMQFSSDVNWTSLDFLVAGCLLLATGLAIDMVLRRVVPPKKRFGLVFLTTTIAFLIWLHLAVGTW
jgi:hypothetical protein